MSGSQKALKVVSVLLIIYAVAMAAFGIFMVAGGSFLVGETVDVDGTAQAANVMAAALGASVVVPAPDGTKVRVRVPAGTQDETVLNIKGKGAPRVKGEGTGDLKVKIDVQVPKAMNDGQKKAMEDFLAATTDDVRSWQ